MIHQEIKISPPLCLAGPPGRAGQGVPGGAQLTSWCREGEDCPSLCSELHEANPWTSLSICILEGKKGRARVYMWFPSAQKSKNMCCHF